jgi:DNA-binding transcriptional MerR regulator
VSGRTYLSIGEVLTLLRQEFPDVTISKIRFLESQGLVDPERTPSGYRKFYDQDVDRLRWVLRQQRDQFLPLKVIKGKLEQEGDAEDFDGLGGIEDADAIAEMTAHDNGDLEGNDFDHSDEPARREEPVLVAQGASTASAARRPSQSLPGFDTAGAAPVETAEMSAAPFAARADHDTEKVVSVTAAPGRRSASRGTGRGKSGSSSRGAAPAAPAPEGAPATMSGSEMTAEELASATDMTVGDIHQLESFGLLSGRMVGGVAYYDEDALAVARTAAAFATFGVEPRHLRLHKHAAEREAGFIEQIVLPLLKQRNPEARQRAQDNVAELTRLGQTLRAILLRNALRDLLGG